MTLCFFACHKSEKDEMTIIPHPKESLILSSYFNLDVNTFLSSKGSPTIIPAEVIRATEEEKKYQISMLETLNKVHKDTKEADLGKLQSAALENENIFTQMMEVAKTCSLGQMTDSLFKVGGQYRRNM